MISIINQKIKKIKGKFEFKRKKIYSFLISDLFFYIILLIFISIFSFLLGKASVKYPINEKGIKNKLIIKNNHNKESKEKIFYVASKKGSVYHLPWCPGALKLKEENKVFFNDNKEAESAGYSPAKNCEGL